MTTNIIQFAASREHWSPQAVEMALPVAKNVPVNDEYYRLVLRAGDELLAQCHAGQFFHLRCPELGGDKPYLRRPMSIYSYFPEHGELHFLYKITGAGTRALRHLKEGESLNVLGPLGRGFTIQEGWKRLVLVARGVGLATLAPLALEARRHGCQLTAICSARHPDVLISSSYFRDLGATVVELTDSEKTSGMANLGRLIEHMIASDGVDAFYTCGSNRILRLLQELGKTHGIPGQIALEQQMACGLGMCHCCVRPFRREGGMVPLRVCREGPVFDIQESVPW